MCGRYYNKRKKQKIAEKLNASKVFADPLPPNYNIAPSTFQPIVRQQRDSDEREMVLARWGMIPFFATSLADYKGISTFLAKAETLSSSPTWKGPLKSRRCLVPADGFYEWKVLDEAVIEGWGLCFLIAGSGYIEDERPVREGGSRFARITHPSRWGRDGWGTRRVARIP